MTDRALGHDEGELGYGGTATVRLIHDQALDRRVAMKTLAREPASQAVVERFLLEARTHARLEHPHIAPVYAFGVDDEGVPWFTMRRLHGRRLDELLAGSAREQTPNELHERVEIFLKVCDAVAYAHSMGVVHRDLKPQNIVVGDFGEVYLMDWGSGMTVDGPRDPQGVVFGTLAYCAPEQARGDNERIDVRTDVFGLGAVLYQILTHEPPYSTQAQGPLGVRDLLRQAQHALARPIDSVVGRDAVPRALNRVAMRALSLDPRDRYASVQELKRDVLAFSRSAWRFRTAVYAPGAEIVREGDAGDEAFIVLSGSCQVTKTDAHRCTVLRTLGAGDVFGETAALTGLPRSAGIRAVDEVKVAVIAFHDLQEHLALDSWSGKIVKTLADRFREADQKRTELTRQLRARDIEVAVLGALAAAGGSLSVDDARSAAAAAGAGFEAGEIDDVLSSSSCFTFDALARRVGLRPRAEPARVFPVRRRDGSFDGSFDGGAGP